MSIYYPLKAIHIIEGESDAEGKPLPGAIVQLERTNGEFIRRVDPKTRQCVPDAQEFVVQPDGTLRPRQHRIVADFKLKLPPA